MDYLSIRPNTVDSLTSTLSVGGLQKGATMGVYKERRKGVWTGKWKAEVCYKGKRVAIKAGFEKKRLGKKWHDEVLASCYSGKSLTKEQRAYSFDDLIKKFRNDYLPTLKVETIRRYEVDLKLRIEPFFCARHIENVDSYLIESFRVSLLKSNTLSKKSINNCMSTLQRMLEKAVDWKMLQTNPHNLKQLKTPKLDYEWWESQSDIHLFINEANHCRYYAAYRLGLDLGMRLGEIVGLSKGDIDLQKGIIKVHRQWLDKENCYGPTKNNLTRYLKFEVGGDLAHILAKALLKSPDKEVIFTTRSGKRIRPRKLSSHFFQKVIKKAKVKRIPFHSLRHTYASWFMMKESDIWRLKEALGHSDVRTTQRYAHHSKRYQKTVSLDWKKDSLQSFYNQEEAVEVKSLVK